MNYLSRRILFATTAAALASSAAFAQSDALDEIVVTAQKRDQNLQDIGISITAYTGDNLKDRGIDEITRIQDITPNLRINRNFGQSTPSYSIRGVGELTNSSTISSSPVAVHINEVAQPYPVTTTNLLFDLERIEILRGPQGDLFGLNTTGGTINYITARPTDEFEASVLAEYGSFDRYKIEGYVSGPISDTLNYRLAVSRNARTEGPQHNVDTGQKYGEFEKTGARLSLGWTPNDRLDAFFEFHVSRDDSEPLGPRSIDTFITADWLPLFGLPGPQSTPEAIQDYWGIRWTPNPAIRPSVTSPFLLHEGTGGSIIVNYDIGDLTLTSVTGFENFEREEFLDYDGNLVQDGYQAFISDLSAFSQEFRLAGNTEKLEWLVGTNYATDDLDQLTIFDQPDNVDFPSTAGQSPTQKRDIWAVFGHTEFAINDKLALTAGLRFTNEVRTQTNIGTFLHVDSSGLWGAFADFGLNPDIVVHPSGNPMIPGAMLTDADFTCFSFTGPCLAGPAPFTDRIEDDMWSGKLGMTYAFNDDMLGYVSFSRGTKSGGFIDVAASFSGQFKPTTIETLNAYEAGIKSTLLDGKLRINGAAFYYDYEDQQVGGGFIDPDFGPLGGIINAPESLIRGAEVEITWAPVEGLTLTQAAGYTFGKFEKHFDVDNAATNALKDANQLIENALAIVEGRIPQQVPWVAVYTDLSGQRNRYPDWQLSGLVQYEWDLTSSLVMRIALDYSYEAATNSDARSLAQGNYNIFNDQTTVPADIRVMMVPNPVGGPDLKAYRGGYSETLFNGRIAVGNGENWEVTLFAHNLGDEQFLRGQGGFNRSRSTVPGMERTWGLRLRYDF
jgi:iron complex outermembrane receptor protein